MSGSLMSSQTSGTQQATGYGPIAADCLVSSRQPSMAVQVAQMSNREVKQPQQPEFL